MAGWFCGWTLLLFGQTWTIWALSKGASLRDFEASLRFSTDAKHGKDVITVQQPDVFSMLFNLFQGTPFRKAIALLISFNAALLGHFMAEMSKAPVKPVSAPEGRAGWWQFATTMALTRNQIASNSPELYQSTLQINDYKSWLHIITLQIFGWGGRNVPASRPLFGRISVGFWPILAYQMFNLASPKTRLRRVNDGQRWSTFYWNWSNHINITMKSSKIWNQWWLC